MAKLRKIKVDLNIGSLMVPVAHGRHAKDMVVLHETVSGDYPGFQDILSVARYMPRNGLGIHAIIDKEGHLAWDVHGDTHLLYHCASNGGNINSRSIGIEQVSRVMIDRKDNLGRFRVWMERDRQLVKTAKLLAYLHRTHRIPLQYTEGRKPGITTHWQISKTYNVEGGHWDCWPRHKGGYYPVLYVVHLARHYHRLGY